MVTGARGGTRDSNCWVSHPGNPIVSDVRRPRQAGPILQTGDTPLRPFRDCSVQYGYGLRLNRIETLTRESYRESEAAFVDPDWELGYGSPSL